MLLCPPRSEGQRRKLIAVTRENTSFLSGAGACARFRWRYCRHGQGQRMRNQRLIVMHGPTTLGLHPRREEQEFPNRDALLPSRLGYHSDLMRRPWGTGPGKAASCGLDRLRIRRGARDHSSGGFDCAGPTSVEEPLPLDHKGRWCMDMPEIK